MGSRYVVTQGQETIMDHRQQARHVNHANPFRLISAASLNIDKADASNPKEIQVFSIIRSLLKLPSCNSQPHPVFTTFLVHIAKRHGRKLMAATSGPLPGQTNPLEGYGSTNVWGYSRAIDLQERGVSSSHFTL